jgi:hypothetical protein
MLETPFYVKIKRCFLFMQFMAINDYTQHRWKPVKP